MYSDIAKLISNDKQTLNNYNKHLSFIVNLFCLFIFGNKMWLAVQIQILRIFLS